MKRSVDAWLVGPAVKPSGREGWRASGSPPGINPPVRALPATSLHFWDGSTMGRGGDGPTRPFHRVGEGRAGGESGPMLSVRSAMTGRVAPAGIQAGIKPGHPSVEPSHFWLALVLAVLLISSLAWLIWFKPYLALSMGLAGACALSVTAIIRELAGDR